MTSLHKKNLVREMIQSDLIQLYEIKNLHMQDRQRNNKSYNRGK